MEMFRRSDFSVSASLSLHVARFSSEALLSSSKGISELASPKEMKDVCWKGIPRLIYEVALGSFCFLLCLPSRHFVIELAAANHLSSKHDQLPNSSNDRGLCASNASSCLLFAVDIYGICVGQIDLNYDQNDNGSFFFLLILWPQPT